MPASMPFRRHLPSCVLLTLLLSIPLSLGAVIVHGVVTDTLGAPVPNATVALVENGRTVSNGKTGADGSFQLSTSDSGRFYVLVAGATFRQLTTQSFYAASLQSVERNLMLEPEWVRQQVVVTAAGTPQPQAQVSASVDVLRKPDFEDQADLVDPLRQIPGVTVVQQGQIGSITSLFVRGGNSTADKIVVDGVPAEDIGGGFDLGTVSTTGVSSVEVNRGPNSALFGSGAAAGVFSITTPRGSTAFPSLLYEGDAGNFHTYRNEVQLGGTHRSIDYYGGFARLNSSNSLPNDEIHNITSVGNLGWTVTPALQIRGTVRYGVAATGLPGAHDFYGISNEAKQSDQDLYASGTIEHQTSDSWHNLARYGLARKREQAKYFSPVGQPITVETPFGPSTNYYGLPVIIRGANGYLVTGQAILNFGFPDPSSYPYGSDAVSNRDQLYAQSDYKFTSHLTGLAGFRFENERGAQREPVFFEDFKLERTNYEYTAQLGGDIKGRVFYTLAGGLQKNQLFGTEADPRIGLAYYPVRPGPGIFHGTKLIFNFAKGVQEPNLFAQFDSLFGQLEQNGEGAIAKQFNIRPLSAQRSRTYDGGVEQNLFSQRVVLRATYFHNEFGNQIEFVNGGSLGSIGVSPQVQAIIAASLGGADVNTLSFRAQGLESEIEYGIGRDIFLRGGYTYLDAVVQHSFSSDAVSPSTNPNIPGVAIGASSPLRGARPFRRPPHTGFASVSYHQKQWNAELIGSFASSSDDSTFLAGSDTGLGNSLLLPNRNLDHGYAKLDLGGSYQLRSWISIYAQANNLLNQQHIGPIGYPALPLNYRAGLRFALGHSRK
jgi:vitamin B12 transporter